MKQSRVSRRDALKLGLTATAGLSLPKLFAQPAFAGPKTTPAKAKSVIQIWMWGGPAHLDTFDPKPAAGRDFCGPLDKPIATNVDGIQIGQLLPKLAKHADKYSIIRSMTHGVQAHETASYITQTGHAPGRLVYPCAGAVVSKFFGVDAGYKGIVPPYIVLNQPQGRFSEAGLLGEKYKPFATGGDPAKKPFVVEGIVAKGISDKRQLSRRGLLGALDLFGKSNPDHPLLKQHDGSVAEAYEMIFGPAKELFDLEKEDAKLRERYGMNTFGQNCLMARRLVEKGVPYVTINYKGWDTHKGHFGIMNQKLPEMDAAMATLLEDLKSRGLLENTIVWWGGEFGRGPKVQWKAPWNGGRSHFGHCFSSVLAGGGFKGGTVIGESDATGSEVKDRPVHPKHVIASIYTQMGIDPEGRLPNPRNLDLKVMPDAQDGLLKEIM